MIIRLKRQRKLMLIGVTMFCLLLVSTVAAVAGEVVTLRPSNTIELALENSPEIQIAEIELENARIDYEKSKAQELSTTSRYSELQAELQIEQARENYHHKENEVIINIFEDYLQILSSREEVTITDKRKELQKRQLEVTEARYQAGHAGRLELAEIEHSYENTSRELSYTRQELKQLLEEFKHTLGLKEDVQVELEAIERPEVMSVSKEEAIEAIVDNDFSLEVNRRQAELAEIDLERGKISGLSSLDIQQLENNLQLAELDLEQGKQDIHNRAQSQYNAFLRSADRMEMAHRSLEQEQQNFEISEEQYQAGTRTENDLLSAEIELLSAENSYNQAIIDYLTGELNLRQSMGQDLGSVYDEQLID